MQISKCSMKKVFLILISFCIIGAGLFLWQKVYLPNDPQVIEKQLFFIEKGEGIEQISLNLKNQGLIKNQYLFKFYTFIKGFSGELQRGIYSLSPSMSISEIANKIRTGAVFTKRITIPEGFTIRQIDERFSEVFNREINLSQFLISDFKDEFEFLKDAPPNRHLEGFLFPDTYQFCYLVSEEDIVRTILRNFDRRLTSEMRETITKQEKLIFEIIVMASLIEREVQTLEDRKLVSGLFWRRIEINMLLQVDATIAYVLQKRELIPEDGWTFQEMRREIGRAREIDSPYNTYKHLGLPVGPISNPGTESILAAINPEDSQYLFFLSTPDGETIFSRTLREHNAAKRKYFNAQ